MSEAALLEALAHRVPAALYLFQVEADGRRHFPFVGAGVREVLGVEPDALAGDTGDLMARIHPDDAADTMAAVERSRRRGNRFERTFRVRTGDGSYRWVHLRATPEVLPGGAIRWYGLAVPTTTSVADDPAVLVRNSTLQQVTDALRDVVVMTDSDGRITFVNPSVHGVLGHAAGTLVGHPIEALFAPEARASIGPLLHADPQPDEGTGWPILRAVHADGRDVWLEITVEPLEVEGSWLGAVFACRDATSRVQDRRAWQREVEYRRAVVDMTNEMLSATLDEGFYQHVMDRVIDLVPDAQGGSMVVLEDGLYHFKAARGFDLDVLQELRLTPAELDRSDPPRVERIHIHETEGRLDPKKLDVFVRAGNLDRIEMTLSVPIVAAGRPRGFLNLDNFETRDAFGPEAVEVAEAVAAQVGIALQRLTLEAELEAERQRLHHLATHDPLTGLPNRRLLEDRLEEALKRARRRDATVAVLYVDLDGFKAVNDRHGHEVGDRLLTLVAERVRDAVREEDTVARVGGDEFVVLAADAHGREGAGRVARELQQQLETPFDVDGLELTFGASMGVALWPEDGRNPGELLRAADAAMYRVKTGAA